MLSKKLIFITLILFLIITAYQWNLHCNHPIAFKSNKIEVVDGSTIILDGKKIKFKGVESPDLEQTCVVIADKEAEHFPCGSFASIKLSKMIEYGSTIECTNEGTDKYGIQLSYCFINGKNLNREMVRDGFAMAYKHIDIFFTIEETIAKIGNKGLWYSEFKEPWEWKKAHRKNGKKSV